MRHRLWYWMFVGKYVVRSMLQVLDPSLGWGTFRQDYGSATWAWLSAATGARLHRSIESATNMPYIGSGWFWWVGQWARVPLLKSQVSWFSKSNQSGHRSWYLVWVFIHWLADKWRILKKVPFILHNRETAVSVWILTLFWSDSLVCQTQFSHIINLNTSFQ